MKGQSKLKNFFKGKKVLIIGGTGTIGSGLTEVILKNFPPAVVRILSNDENALFCMKQGLKNFPNARFLVGDVRDKERMRWAARDIDYVFHSAALKHVSLCEYNPFDAVETNVLGTQNIIEVCLEEKVKRMIFIGTDKAVFPTSTMGATKLLAERLVLDASAYKGKIPVIFSCVRFGNVLGSRGSIIPLIKGQISQGGPVTITDRAATRFIMSTEEAVRLVIKGASLAKGGEIFILKMPSVKIIDLLRVLIDNFAPFYNLKPENISIEEIGLRRGEKLHEDLMSEQESRYAAHLEDMLVINHPKRARKKTERFSSDKNIFLGKGEIENLLKATGLLKRRKTDAHR
ncbi:MAG: NAD-dependent epimerase/dehydratase family protein [Candidatus Omnitrophica bacterium]|nr:NAD-dependent epimerase/dehydratase family protein [Candidatus Omnitrophota bacterium]MBD3269245.1 NAD-dependent epimerase/dehydratase family protein [Candidatus Omnitrophota bacterium]